MSPELEWLYLAASKPIGIVLRSSNTTLLMQRLYAERKKAADPMLDTLSISRRGEDELFIIKRAEPQEAKDTPDEAKDTPNE